MGRTTVVYLGGFGRSGSTLVERFLGAAPGWVNVGELVDLARSVAPHDELCGCGCSFSTCPLWGRVGDVAFGGWSDEVFDRMRTAHRAAARQRHLPGLLRTSTRPSPELVSLRADYAAIYGAVAEVTGATVVVDASKGPALGQALAGAPGIDLRMLNIVRDPRAVAWSWQREVVRPHDVTGTDQMWRIPVHRAAAQWSALQVEMELVSRLGHRPGARMRYEDFVKDPVSTVVEATAALGVPVRAVDLPVLPDGSIVLEPSHGLSGNPSRFRSGTIRLRSDESWASEMPPRAKAVVAGLTLPLLRGYGYVGPRTSSAAPARPDAALRPSSEEVDDVAPGQPSATEHGDQPLVSVVIPTHGRPDLLRETVATILDQDYAGPMEIVVVHDGEPADPALEGLSRPGREVRTTTNARTRGLCGARNTGVLASRGTFVASCDDDDLWDLSKVRKQVQRLQADPSLVVVGTGIRLLMGGKRGDVEWPASEAVVSHDRLLQNRVKELHSSNLMMRRTSFDSAGLYDEDLPHGYGEDYDWLLRASTVGRVGVVQETLADIRKDIPSWFRDRWVNTATALEYLLDKHPDFGDHRRGHARILGQIAYAHAAAGERLLAARLAARALRRHPAVPYAWLALAVAGPGTDHQRLLSMARRLGRGLS
jgi:GT2 family glycosyltransferase